MTDYQQRFREIDEEVQKVVLDDRARQDQLRAMAVETARNVFHPVLHDIATSFSRSIDPSGNHQYAHVDPVHVQMINERNTTVSLRLITGRSFETREALTFNFDVAAHYSRDTVTISASANANGYGRLALSDLLDSATPNEDLANLVFSALKAYKLDRAGVPTADSADRVRTPIVI